MSVLEDINNAEYDKSKGFNSMGVSENWYNPHLLIKESFTKEELDSMTERELELLLRLSNSATDIFY